MNRIKEAINPSLNNNTNYMVGLDTAKKWLLTPSITSNPTKAIIFLSDGQPTGTNPDGYLEVLKATCAQMPGTIKLSELFQQECRGQVRDPLDPAR